MLTTLESYTNLGQIEIQHQKQNNQDKEIQRRITAGWTAFAKHRDIFNGNIGTCLKNKSTGAET